MDEVNNSMDDRGKSEFMHNYSVQYQAGMLNEKMTKNDTVIESSIINQFDCILCDSGAYVPVLSRAGFNV